jgi:hypothetical protein
MNSSVPDRREIAIGGHPTVAIVTVAGPADEYLAARLADLCGQQMVAWLTLPAKRGEPKAWSWNAAVRHTADGALGLRAKLGISLLRRKSPRRNHQAGPLAMELARMPPSASQTAQPRAVADEAEAMDALRQLDTALVVCSPSVSVAFQPPVRGACLRLAFGRPADSGDANAVLRAVEAGDLDGIRCTVCARGPEAGAWQVVKTSMPCLALDDTPATLIDRCVILGVKLACAAVEEAIACGAFQVLSSNWAGVGQERDSNLPAVIDAFRRGLAPSSVAHWIEF